MQSWNNLIRTVCLASIYISFNVYGSDVAITPKNIVGNSLGTEFIIDFEADFGGGVIDTGTVYIDGNRFSVIGTEILPAATNELVVSYNAAPPPCTPNPITGICEIGIEGQLFDTNPFDDGFQTHAILPPSQSTQNYGVILPIVICGVGMAINHGFQMHACRGNGGIQESSHGICGMFGGSHVQCNEPDETPPEEPDIPEGPDMPDEPPSEPPPCDNSSCDNFWDWNRNSMSWCLSHDPAACY